MASPKSPDQVLSPKEYAEQLIAEKRAENKAVALTVAGNATAQLGQLGNAFLHAYGGIDGYVASVMENRAKAMEIGKPGVVAKIDGNLPLLLQTTARLGGGDTGNLTLDELQAAQTYFATRVNEQQPLAIDQSTPEVSHDGA